MGLPPPWILEYAIRVALREAAKRAPEEAGTEDTPADNPYAGRWYRDSDRVTDEQRAKAMQRLADQGFTHIRLPAKGVYYGQNDKDRWATHPYPKLNQKEGTVRAIGDAGCAPSALAIADSILRGTRTTPPEVADYAVDKKVSGKEGRAGSNTVKLVEKWAADHDLDRVSTKDVDEIRKGLDLGGVAVVNVKGGIFNQREFTDADKDPPGGGGHEIAVIGYALDEHGKEWYFVSNPGKDASAKYLKGDGVVVDKDLHHGAGRVRVSREVLEKYIKNGAHVLTNGADNPASTRRE